MARTQTMVQLSEDLVRRLDAEAEREGVSRSSLIRQAVEARLASSREEALSRRIVEGYRSSPQGRPDEWGPLDSLADASAAEALKRLDHEEAERW